MRSQSMVTDVFATKLPSNPVKAVQAVRARLRSPSALNSMPYFRDFCRFFQYQPPALSLQCIEVSQTSSDSEDVSLQKRHLLSVRTDHAVSCRLDTANKEETRGKHLQYLKKFSITWRSGGRKIPLDPIEDLAMHALRRHPVSMIRLKPLPDDVAILDQSHIFRGARSILGYVAEHGAIPLTPSKAFKRVFVN